MGKAVRFFGWLAAFLLATGCAAAVVVGLGGGFIERLDIPNHFIPFWLTGALVAGVVSLFGMRGRARRLVLIPAVIALAICGWRVAPELAARWTPGAKPEGERLKLVHFNVYFKNSAPERSVDWILAQDADVVTLVEAEGLPPAQVARLRARYPYCNGCFGGGSWWSNLVLSKQPAVAEGRFELRRGMEAGFPINGGWSRFVGRGGAFTIVAVHLDWPWRWAGPSQRASLAAFIQRTGTPRTILAGDFNMTPWSTSLRWFDRHLGVLTRRTHGQASWPAQDYYRLPAFPVKPLPFLPIDQVYAGPAWKTVKVTRGPRLGSDHFPIMVELVAAKP